MLTDEQSSIVRAQISKVFNVEIDAVVPTARLFADLGGTAEQLGPMQRAIEAALSVQIDPVVKQVNARTAIAPSGLLTTESKAQIVAYLGKWPGVPIQPVSFPDLCTVGMIEAMTAKAAVDAPAEMDEPLQLSPELTKQVRQVIADLYRLPLDQVHSDLDLSSLTKDADFTFARAMIDIKSALGINFDVEMDLLKRGFAELSHGSATPWTMQKLRRLVPNLDSLSDDEGLGSISTVGMIERVVAAAIERRESPEAARNHAARRESVGLFLSNWSWSDQDWWAGLPAEMGIERFRLYLIGMLRAAYMEASRLDGDLNEILEVAEKFAEAGSNPATLDKTYRRLTNQRKPWRTAYWGGLACVVKRACTPEDGANVLAAVENAFHWKQPELIAAARQWQRSMVSPLQDSTEFAAEWCTPEVVALARQMHDNRAFIDFPKLGTLLEEAGCHTAVILDHCRDPERRHLRGDWLLTAILTAEPTVAPTTARGKAGSRTAKPKKPKLPAMSSAHKKRFKELLIKERGGLPLATAWTAVWQSDYPSDQDSFRKRCPELPTESLLSLGGMFPSLRTVWPDVAIVRRLQFQSVADLQTTLALNARVGLMIWHAMPRFYEMADHFRDAFAAGDEASLRWAFHELPSPQYMDADLEYWTYLAFRAIYARDESRMQMLQDRWPHPENSKNVSCLQNTLRAILRGIPVEVVSALNALLDHQRTFEDPEGFGAFSLTAFACYRAAHWRDPALVADFDVTQSAPWDAEYHAASIATSPPLDGFDFSTTPPEFRDLMLTQSIPQWLRDLQLCPQNVGDSIALILTDIGPNPDAVYTQVKTLKSDWNRAEFDHRVSKLPVTLTSQISRLTGTMYRDKLQKTGATVEIV